MPTIDNIHIPAPLNWEDFEKIAECYARLRWPKCTIVPYGTNSLYICDFDPS